MALAAPLLLGSVACSAGDEGEDDDALASDGEDEPETQVTAEAVASCKKLVYVHVSNFTNAAPLNSGAVRPNGCWGFNMAKRNGRYMGDCKGAMNKGGGGVPGTWINGWGGDANWTGKGSKLWFYNETSFAHDPSDEVRVDNCFGAFRDHWNTTPHKGYAYMMYRGQAGWKAVNNGRISVNFAELYGPGNWMPFWDQWKANPVGRPMVNIADGKDGAKAHEVVKTVCDQLEPSTFMGIYVGTLSGGMPADSAAFAGVVRALNECTGK